jgi:hypothetical protein
VLRRRLATAGLLAAAACASIVVASSAAGRGALDTRCHAATSADGGPGRLGFEVRCNFEPSQIRINPDREVVSVRERAIISGGDPGGDPGQEMSCRRSRRGRSILCRGHAEDRATIAGRFRVAGDPCATATEFAVGGGVDCDGDEACIEIYLTDQRQDRRPSGC